MKHGILSVVLGACMLLAASPAVSAVPSTMSYQGVLTDNLGNLVPDGNYNLTFRIYNVPVAGAALWTENFPVVAVTKGGFSVILGSTTPLTLPFDVQYYLGVTVGPNPEMTPRVTLASSPYGLSLRLPFAGANNAGVVTLDIGNNAGPAIRANNRLDVGSSGGDGDLRMFMNGVGNSTLQGYGNFCGQGGGLLGFNETGAVNWGIEPDCTGEGSFVLFTGFGGSQMLWHGEPAGGVMGFLSLGGNSNFLFDTNASGDASTQLPANAVDSGEILDESGIASNHIATFGFIPSNNSGALSDLISITITTPAAGYVTVSGDFQANFINAAARAIGYQISETSGGPLDANYYFYAGVFNASMGGWIPCAIHRTFFKAAGAYTFYLQAYNENGTSVAYFNPTITAEFSSTSYGAVTTIASASEAATFRHATPVAASAAATQPVGRGYVVDLRELEMKVRADEAQLAESQRALREAQAREQGIAHVVLTSVKK